MLDTSAHGRKLKELTTDVATLKVRVPGQQHQIDGLQQEVLQLREQVSQLLAQSLAAGAAQYMKQRRPKRVGKSKK